MNKLRPQEKAERYIIAPSTSMYLGVKVTKDTDISDKVKNEFGTTYQTIKDLTLTTIVKRKSNAYDMEKLKKEQYLYGFQTRGMLYRK